MIEKLPGFTNFLDFYTHISNPANSELLVCPDCNNKVRIVIGRSFDLRFYGRAEITCLNEKCEFNKNKIVIEGG